MKLFSTRYNAGSFNTALLALRLGFGILMVHHGYDKIIHFSTYKHIFINLMGLGNSASLTLAIFAEFFCSILIILGLFTRLACIPLIILCLVIIFKSTGTDYFGESEMGELYLTAFVALLFTGAGKISVDNMISK